MALTLTVQPAAEPLTLGEAKHHLRVDGSDDDSFIESLITTSRLHIEATLGIALITQGWKLTLDRWPGQVVALPLRPLKTVDAVRVFDGAGAAVPVDASAYTVDIAAGRIFTDSVWPHPGRTHAGIELDFTAGFGASASDVPEPIRQALKLLVAHWYEHREAVTTGDRGARIPIGVSDLLAPWKAMRL
ncbi:MAG: hypothetical protein RLZ98_1964 [Pseudomonadota bacterium]|jgi:uncharacterized phiE125 gp8 family phage protein